MKHTTLGTLGSGCPCSFHKVYPNFYNRGVEGIRRNVYSHWESEGRPQQKLITPKHVNVRLYSANPNDLSTDYAFEMAASNIRFGAGVTREVGLDCQDLGAKNVIVFVDPNLAKMKGDSPVNIVLQSLQDAKIRFSVFSDISIEPTDSSFKKAIAFASREHYDVCVAVGGGSTMDTAKAANLYATHPVDDFLDYVNPPIGKGKIPPGPVRPLIAIPTTAGTGSETTGVAIFDYEEKQFKTGIAHRLIKPVLGIVDPNNTKTSPPNVSAASGFDVLCHSMESYTAIPYNLRKPRPSTPRERPAYQGANPISDFWSLKALEMTAKYLPRVYKNQDDEEARGQMLLAATFAGIGFGNGGVHLCHGMSYPVAGLAKKLGYHPKDYPKKSMVPHGISVILHAPSVFKWTSEASPDRHRNCARILGMKNTDNIKDEDVGLALKDALIPLLKELEVPDGLQGVGYNHSDIPTLVEGTIPQHRVIKLSPRPVGREELTKLFEDAMKIY